MSDKNLPGPSAPSLGGLPATASAAAVDLSAAPMISDQGSSTTSRRKSAKFLRPTLPVRLMKTKNSSSGQLTRKDVITGIVMPLVLFLLTAVSINVIGNRLQERSFVRNELFKARLQRLIAAQDEARRIRNDGEDAFRTLRSREDYARTQIGTVSPELRQQAERDYYQQVISSPALQTLRRTKVDVDILVQDVGGGPNSESSKTAGAYTTDLSAFRECVRDNTRFERSCADEHAQLIDHLQELVVVLGRRADQFIAEQND